MIKKYKIDFNNGKVFEATKIGENEFRIEGGECDLIILYRGYLELSGATITEIEEPRREFTLVMNKFLDGRCLEAVTYDHSIEGIRVVEVIKGEVIVSREKLRDAYIHNCGSFKDLCKELGLGE